MKNYTPLVKAEVFTKPENCIIEANALYQKFSGTVPEAAYYKILERMTTKGDLVHLTKGLYYRPKTSKFGNNPLAETDIVKHYMEQHNAIFIGYRLYNRLGLTTQVGKRSELLSNAVPECVKNINNVCIKNCELNLTAETIPIIETLEILQHYYQIEDINKKALALYMLNFSATYSDELTVSVLEKRKYKKSTIALLERFLNYNGVPNTLGHFLSPLSKYNIPEMTEFYTSNL